MTQTLTFLHKPLTAWTFIDASLFGVIALSLIMLAFFIWVVILEVFY